MPSYAPAQFYTPPAHFYPQPNEGLRQGILGGMQAGMKSIAENAERKKRMTATRAALDQLAAVDPRFEGMDPNQRAQLLDSVAQAAVTNDQQFNIPAAMQGTLSSIMAQRQEQAQQMHQQRRQAAISDLIGQQHGVQVDPVIADVVASHPSLIKPPSSGDQEEKLLAKLDKINTAIEKSEDPRMKAQLVKMRDAVMAQLSGYQKQEVFAEQEALGQQVENDLAVLEKRRGNRPGLSRIWPGDQTAAHAADTDKYARELAAKYGVEPPSQLIGDALDEYLRNILPQAIKGKRQQPTSADPYAGLSGLGVNPLVPPQQAAAMSQPAPAAQSAPGDGQPKPVRSQAEYDALPAGSEYLDSQGNIRRKGG